MLARALLLTLLLVAVGCSSASASVSWLCGPGVASDPCRGDLTTRVYAPDGSSTVTRSEPAAAPGVDCFYVYPTVSNQLGPNATQAADPEVRSIATFQAQQFSSVCRVFAPLYRQVTAIGVTVASQTKDAAPYSVGYADVEEAFRAYVRDNPGRGFVLLGHSQGSRILRALLHRVIEKDAALRARLVGAVIPGANALVNEFPAIPACTALGEKGCLVSYSTFNETPPANARFGRTDTDPVGAALDLPRGDVVCVDPAVLTGTPLQSLVPSAPFAPGLIGTLTLAAYGGVPPTSPDTPWLTPQDHYTGACTRENGANVLKIAPVGGARKLNPEPDATWGTHVVDLNLPMGNLLTIVREQAKAYLKPPRALRVTLGARRTGAARRQLVALVRGEPGTELRVRLLRGTTFLTRRSFTLGESGAGRVLFRASRAGSYVVTVEPAAGGKRVRSGVRRLSLK